MISQSNVMISSLFYILLMGRKFFSLIHCYDTLLFLPMNFTRATIHSSPINAIQLSVTFSNLKYSVFLHGIIDMFFGNNKTDCLGLFTVYSKQAKLYFLNGRLHSTVCNRRQLSTKLWWEDDWGDKFDKSLLSQLQLFHL